MPFTSVVMLVISGVCLTVGVALLVLSRKGEKR